jgi:hypothetical protein
MCRAWYHVERLYYEHLTPSPLDPWPVIAETKQP